MYRRQAFTLAETLISLALLGVLAAIIIPGILQSTAQERENAQVKEALSVVSMAYQRYQQDHPGAVPAQLTLQDLRPYLNHYEQDVTSKVDNRQGGVLPSLQCSLPDNVTTSAAAPSCWRLPGGQSLCTTPQFVLEVLLSTIVYRFRLIRMEDSMGVLIYESLCTIVDVLRLKPVLGRGL